MPGPIEEIVITAPADRLSPLAATSLDEAEKLESRHRRFVLVRLLLVTAGALFGALTLTGVLGRQPVDWFGVAGLLAFLGVLLVRQTGAFESDLLEKAARGRAVAYIVESQAWRLAVAAHPYPPGLADRRAREEFFARTAAFRTIVAGNGWASDAFEAVDDGAAMSGRRDSLEARKKAYLDRRIRPLLERQSRNNGVYTRRYRRLTRLMLLIEVAGIPIGVVKAVAVSNIDLLSVTAAAAASLMVWIDTLDLKTRAGDAANLCAALTAAIGSLNDAENEHEWSAAVLRVEDALVLGSEARLATDTMKTAVSGETAASTVMTPEAYFAAAAELKRKIWEENHPLPKLEPDVIVGVNPGGAILGGLLYFMTRASDFLPLSLRSGLTTGDLTGIVDAVQWNHRRPDRLSILVVDASVKTGDSMRAALEILHDSLTRSGWSDDDDEAVGGPRPAGRYYTIRTATIARQPVPVGDDRRVRVDYYVDETTEKFPYGSI